ncbi:phosphate ABC transporter permease subunit PstC [Aquihabitans sp. McL0605]|uniref:phosphate ABC transporter permease subunit PstC n=1 Tax=Aquihabitans sp. McL0605 TaxID=3415671 RepID=UPI003CFB3681
MTGALVDEGMFPDTPFRPEASPTAPDRVFLALATIAACVSLAIVLTTFVFLVKESRPAFAQAGVWNFFTDSIWNPAAGRFGVFGLIMGTVIIATIAMILAVPFAIGMALFINEFAPSWLRPSLTSMMDLLAALPSILYGLWAFFALQPKLTPVARWGTNHLSVIPFFRLSTEDATLTSSSFVAGVVVAFMIIPIITSVSRDVMAQVPREQCEGALALGGTRWGMIREVILPFGRSGIVGAALLGFGRALGETIAVALVVSLVFKANPHILELGAGSIAALIATRFGEADSIERSGLVGAGLALFILTFVVNIGARRIVARTKVA